MKVDPVVEHKKASPARGNVLSALQSARALLKRTRPAASEIDQPILICADTSSWLKRRHFDIVEVLIGLPNPPVKRGRLMAHEKRCFVVSPIGEADSPIRKRADGHLREVIKPVVEASGYTVVRGDQDKAPGLVTERIVQWMVDADLVVADLHGHNPNVMYEVAIRHATGRPIIQMIERGESLPFDITGLNTIFYDPSVDGLISWRSDLEKALKAVERGGPNLNPVARAGLYKGLQASEEPQGEVLAEVLRELSEMRSLLQSMLAPTGNREIRQDPSMPERKKYRDAYDPHEIEMLLSRYIAGGRSDDEILERMEERGVNPAHVVALLKRLRNEAQSSGA